MQLWIKSVWQVRNDENTARVCVRLFVVVSAVAFLGSLVDQRDCNPFALIAPRAAAAEKPKAGDTFADCNDGCPDMVVVPPGTFVMGSSDPAQGPPHSVAIGAPFGAGRFEVTFAQWEACVTARGCRRKPVGRWGRGIQPVTEISWNDAKEYVAWLSRKTGKIYRLLTEAEWEYAARAGSTTAYNWGDEIGRGNANCVGCGSEWDDKQPAPVGSFRPNAFGLDDMHGNVWEWVEDCWQYGYDESPNDGRARTDCPDRNERVMRGGAFLHPPSASRSAVRSNYSADGWANGLGFRVARSF